MFRLLVIVVLVFSSHSLESQLSDIEENPNEEVDKLLLFLMNRNDFGYTLIGEKPVSIISFPYKRLLNSPYRSTFSHRALFDRIPNLKKAHPTTSFLWLTIEDDNAETFALIHTESTKKVILNHKEAFKLDRGATINEEMIKKIVSDCLTHCLHYELGLLLGYGESNSFHFSKQMTRLKKLSAIKFTTIKVPRKIKELPCDLIAQLKSTKKDFFLSQSNYSNQLVEEILCYEKAFVPLQQLHHPLPLECIGFPIFMVDKASPESKSLLSKYLNAKRKISAIIKSDQSLELIKKAYTNA